MNAQQQQQMQQIWLNFALSSVQGTAGSVLDDPAANAIAIADEMLEGFMSLPERMEQRMHDRASGIVVPRPNVPSNLKGVG